MKALITGFDPFGGDTINPAYEAVKLMKNKIGQCEIIKQEIPTIFYKSLKVLEDAIEREQPDFVICVGQAGGRYSISVEKVSINLDEARIPDNDGQIPMGTPIKKDGNTAYFSTLPNKAIVKELIDCDIPATISYSAGTYVCNHIFYGLMYTLSKKYPKIRGGFIHVPFSPIQVIGRKNMPFMPLEMMSKGLELAVKATVDNEKDISAFAGTIY